MTDRILRRMIIIIMVVAIALPFMSPEIFASSKVNVSGGDNVKVGESFSLTVTYSGGDVGRVDGQLEYDTDSMSYLSGGTSSGDTGYVQLNKAGIDGTITFTLKFKALNSGNPTVYVSTNDMYDLDERAMETPSVSKTINISGVSSSQGNKDGSGSQGDSDKDKTLDSGNSNGTEATNITDSSDLSDIRQQETGGINSIMVLLIMAVIVAVIIAVIAVVLVKKRR